MTRKLITPGVALMAVLALAAISASVASAQGRYTTSSYPTTGTGESPVGNGTFTTEAGKTECKTHFEATLSSASAELTVNATVVNCKAFGFLSATVTMGSCDYSFGTPTGSGDIWSAPVKIVCGATPITIVAGTCELTIGAQTPTGGVAITNDTAAGDVTVKPNMTGIGYTVTKDGIGCPFGGTGVKTGATSIYDAAVTFDSTNGTTIDIG